jgi:hypothetical protein
MGEPYVRRIEIKGLDRNVMESYLEWQRETLKEGIQAGDIHPEAVEKLMSQLERSINTEAVHVEGLGSRGVSYRISGGVLDNDYSFFIIAEEGVPLHDIRELELDLLETLLGYGCEIRISRQTTKDRTKKDNG